MTNYYLRRGAYRQLIVFISSSWAPMKANEIGNEDCWWTAISKRVDLPGMCAVLPDSTRVIHHYSEIEGEVLNKCVCAHGLGCHSERP